MSDLGFGYDLLEQHRQDCLISNNPFSVRCVLTSKETGGASQGRGASLDPNSADVLRGLPNFIGLQISADTGLPILGDSAEFVLNINDLMIGRPEKGWIIEFPLQDGIWRKFKVEACMEDRVVGIYRLQISIVTRNDLGRRVTRQRNDYAFRKLN